MVLAKAMARRSDSSGMDPGFVGPQPQDLESQRDSPESHMSEELAQLCLDLVLQNKNMD